MKKPKFKRLKKTCFPHDHDASTAESYNHQSAELIGSNDDLVTEILIRLPAAKSFFRFRSVSKQWLSLLTHPRFNTLRFDKLLISSGLYYHELYVPFDVQNPTTPPFRGLDFSLDDDHIDGIRIVQSCNGLLLCCCDKDRGCSGNYYVCNPTTKEVAAIPFPPVTGDRPELIRLMGLAYHPTECAHYKLVCILQAGETMYGDGFNDAHYYGLRMYKIQIYSSQTGEWKKLRQTFTPKEYTDFRYGVYWNGAFHWAPSCPNPMYLRLDTEQIHELPLPSPLPVRVASAYGGYSFDKIPLYFGESGGHLHLVDISHEKDPLSLNVYEMLRDHSGWSIKVLDVVRGEEEEEEDMFMAVKVVDDIKRFNIRDKSFKQLFRVPDNIERFDGNGTKTFSKTVHRFVGHRYIEKIASF
uniref:F-box protein At5g07610-like n=1 Tax=Erigeron canadensis TaxID=72917 RepID=UPI001CB89B67|nr:F-box protein At5g07610-like [Erigeron canadensis]